MAKNADDEQTIFTQSPLKDYARQLQVEKGRVTLTDALNNNLTTLFLLDIKYRLEHEKNIILTIWGDSGAGKSTIAQFLGKYIIDHIPEAKKEKLKKEFGREPKFDISHVCFSRAEFLARVEESIPFDTILYDEDNDVHFGIGAGREQEQLERINKIVRAEQNNFIFCNPDQTNRQQHFTLQAFDINPEKKLNRALIFDRQRNEIGYANMLLGVIITPQHIIPGYNDKKIAYVRETKARTSRERYQEHEKVANQIYEKYADKLFTQTGNFRHGIGKGMLELLVEKEVGENKYASTEIERIINIIKLINVNSSQKENADASTQEKPEENEKEGREE